MKIRDFLSTEPETGKALDEVCADARQAFSDRKPDLGLLFAGAQHASRLADAGDRILEATGVETLIGCTADSVIAGQREIERSPAIALWLGCFPGVRIQPFHASHSASEDAIGFQGLPESLGAADQRGQLLLLLADPFSFPVDEFIREVNDNYPGLRVVGGVASGGTQPGTNRLMFGSELHAEGAVGLHLSGPIQIRTVVSQGCRPVGKRYVVTQANGNVIFEMSGMPAAECVKQLLDKLPDDERYLFEKGPHVGFAIDEHREDFRRGDYLIRNILGWDPQSGGLVVNDHLRRGQSVQFHIRDASAASEDLEALLAKSRESAEESDPSGGLIFTCNGRGTRMFEGPNHDAERVRSGMGEIPLAGFFAAGELGPVAGKNFLHGFTASLVFFGPGVEQET